MSSISFEPSVPFPAGSIPKGIAYADFNGDGIPDLAVVDESPSNSLVAILLGNGNGTFKDPVTYPLGYAITSRGIAAADLRRSGKMDLVVTNWDSANISVLFGNGDGTFQTATNYYVGNRPLGIVAVDLNNNGYPDLAIAEYENSNRVFVLFNNGAGAFPTSVFIPLNSSTTGAWGITAADFNSDNKMDLAVSVIESNQVAVIIGNGNGTFQTPLYYAVGNTPRGIIASDLDGDGKIDLAVAEEGSNDVAVLMSNGNGTFKPAAHYPVASGSSPFAVAAADFDQDGNVDLATVNFRSDNIAVLQGNGNGTFELPVFWGVGSFPWDITTADFNGDGKMDLAATDSMSNTVAILLNNSITLSRGVPFFK